MSKGEHGMDQGLIDAAKAGDVAAVQNFLNSGADVNQGDEQGWTLLNFAAGKGHLDLVKFLVERGADPFKVGRDRRTPYMIALAAGRVEVVKYLREAEDKTDPEKAKSFRPERKYCKAYHLNDLRAFSNWSESRINWKDKRDQAQAGEQGTGDFTDEKIVFIHQDFTVTESIWHEENVIFNEVSDQWREFCATALSFKVPTDLDLMVPNTETVQG
jgi:hypothetical protein